AWCQDNDVSWVDWSLKDTNADFLRFVREMIWLRRRHPVFRRRRFFHGELGRAAAAARRDEPAFPPGGPVRPGEAGVPTDPTGRHPIETPAPADGPAVADIHWHGREPGKADFAPASRQLAFALDGRFTGRDGDPDYTPDRDFYVAMNASPGP